LGKKLKADARKNRRWGGGGTRIVGREFLIARNSGGGGKNLVEAVGRSEKKKGAGEAGKQQEVSRSFAGVNGDDPSSERRKENLCQGVSKNSSRSPSLFFLSFPSLSGQGEKAEKKAGLRTGRTVGGKKRRTAQSVPEKGFEKKDESRGLLWGGRQRENTVRGKGTQNGGGCHLEGRARRGSNDRARHDKGRGGGGPLKQLGG